MKDFHSYSINICDASWNQFEGCRVSGLPVTKHEERNVLGRASLETVLAWLDAKKEEVLEKIDEMKSMAKDRRIVVFARLPVRAGINGECFHQFFDNLPPDVTVIDALKERVAQYYQL